MVVVLALSGCAGFGIRGGDDTGDRVTVRFTYLWAGSEGEAVERVIDKFNASQDKITVVGTSNPDQQAQVLSMQGSNPQFDISATGNSQIVQWARAGVVLSLEQHVTDDDYDTADFIPPALINNTVDGELYALPVASNTYQLLYNTELLAEAGFSGPPETFEDWAAVIDKLTKEKSGKLSAMGTNPSVDLQLLTLAYGGAWYDEAGNPTPDNPTNIEALNWWVDHVVKKYGAAKLQAFQSGLGEYGTANDPFYTGAIATMIDGNWASAFITKAAPDLTWDAAPLPYPEGRPELKGTSRLDLSNLFIPTNSAHPAEAWEFMKFYLAPEQMRDFTVALANLPGRTSLLDDPAYGELANFDAFLEAVKSPLNVPTYSTEHSAEYGQDLSAAFSEILAGKAEPAAAMQRVAEKSRNYGR